MTTGDPGLASPAGVSEALCASQEDVGLLGKRQAPVCLAHLQGGRDVCDEGLCRLPDGTLSLMPEQAGQRRRFRRWQGGIP